MAKSSSHIMCSSASLAFLVHLEGCASVFASILYLVPVSTDIPFWRFKNFGTWVQRLLHIRIKSGQHLS